MDEPLGNYPKGACISISLDHVQRKIHMWGSVTRTCCGRLRSLFRSGPVQIRLFIKSSLLIGLMNHDQLFGLKSTYAAGLTSLSSSSKRIDHHTMAGPWVPCGCCYSLNVLCDELLVHPLNELMSCTKMSDIVIFLLPYLGLSQETCALVFKHCAILFICV